MWIDFVFRTSLTAQDSVFFSTLVAWHAKRVLQKRLVEFTLYGILSIINAHYFV